MSPLKDTKVNLLGVGLSAPGREIYLFCKWNWNSRPFNPQSSALTNRPDAPPPLEREDWEQRGRVRESKGEEIEVRKRGEKRKKRRGAKLGGYYIGGMMVLLFPPQ